MKNKESLNSFLYYYSVSGSNICKLYVTYIEKKLLQTWKNNRGEHKFKRKFEIIPIIKIKIHFLNSVKLKFYFFFLARLVFKFIWIIVMKMYLNINIIFFSNWILNEHFYYY